MNQVVPFIEPLICQMTYKYANGSINIEKTLKYKVLILKVYLILKTNRSKAFINKVTASERLRKLVI
jgi:hypothetical protein